MKTPKEDPADKAARLRERRISEIERSMATEKQAGGLMSDIGAVYGIRSIPLFGMAGKPTASQTPSVPTRWVPNWGNQKPGNQDKKH